MKTFRELYAQWEKIQKIYHESNREIACNMMGELQATVAGFKFSKEGKHNWTTFCELAETMDCGNNAPVIRNAFLKVEDYDKFFNDFGITEFTYCEESTMTLQNIAEFLELGWKVDMHAADVRAYKWDEKTRKALRFTKEG